MSAGCRASWAAAKIGGTSQGNDAYGHGGSGYRAADQGALSRRQRVSIDDLAGDGDHYAATVVSEAFRGKSRVEQHKMVYDALKGQMGGALHALALKTHAPS